MTGQAGTLGTRMPNPRFAFSTLSKYQVNNAILGITTKMFAFKHHDRNNNIHFCIAVQNNTGINILQASFAK